MTLDTGPTWCMTTRRMNCSSTTARPSVRPTVTKGASVSVWGYSKVSGRSQSAVAVARSLCLVSAGLPHERDCHPSLGRILVRQARDVGRRLSALLKYADSRCLSLLFPVYGRCFLPAPCRKYRPQQPVPVF